MAMEYLNTQAAADMIGRHRATVSRWCLLGMLKARKNGRDWLISVNDMRKLTLPKRGRKKR